MVCVPNVDDPLTPPAVKVTDAPSQTTLNAGLTLNAGGVLVTTTLVVALFEQPFNVAVNV